MLFSILVCAAEGADDAPGSSAGEADRQPGDLRGSGAGSNNLTNIIHLFTPPTGRLDLFISHKQRNY